MDLIKAKKCIEEFYQKIKFEYSFEENTNYIQGRAANVKLNGIDDNIAVNIGVFANDTMFIEFIFDKVSKIDKIAPAMNTINQTFPFTKAYITEKGYFCVAYSALCVPTIEILNKSLYDIFNIVGNDSFIKILQSITKYTK